MNHYTPKDAARDTVTVTIQTKHADAQLYVTEMRTELARVLWDNTDGTAYRRSAHERAQLQRSLAFAEELERAWAAMLDLAHGQGDNDNDAIVDDGGE